MTCTDPLADVPILRLDASGRGTVITRKSWVGTTDKMQTLFDLVRDKPLPEERGRVVFQDRPYFDRFVRAMPELWDTGTGRRARLARAHALVQRTTAYENEPCEIFEAPSHVRERGRGDCEDMAGELAAIIEAMSAIERMRGGMPFGWHMLAIGGTEDDPEHVTNLVAPSPAERSFALPVWAPAGYEPPDGWFYAETTIAAGFGEDPYVAAERVDAQRPELRATAAV